MSTPNYLEPVLSAFEELEAAIASDENNREAAVAALLAVSNEGERQLATIQERWYASATTRVGEVCARGSIALIDANNAGEIQPPLTEPQLDIIRRKNLAWRTVSESGAAKDPKAETPTDKAKTSGVKR